MAKIEKMEYDENRVKMYGIADVIEEIIAKINEIIEVANQPKSKGKKEKGKRVDVKGEEKGDEEKTTPQAEYEIDQMGFARKK